MDYENRLSILKNKLEEGKMKKARAEATLESLMIQKKELLKELDNLGIAPEKLQETIENTKKEIDRLLQQAESMMPNE